MAKFINKKEQVYDLQLTPYGRYLLSVGSFKPIYYAFYDDNVVYDNRYTSNTISEPQNNIHKRIKDETQYLESLTLFTDLEMTSRTEMGGTVDFFNLKGLSAMKKPGRNVFKFDSAIGDAYLDGGANIAPAWKIIALQSTISGAAAKDTANQQDIPQIDVDAVYVKKIKKAGGNTDPKIPGSDPLNIRDLNFSTKTFADNNIIVLEQRDPVFYIEEVNTELLTHNFEVEIFEVFNSSITGESLQRKYFESYVPQIEKGIMISPTRQKTPTQNLTTDSVEYYFDLLVDGEADQNLACRGADMFNNQSYYVNLDFDCSESKDESVFYDIYGSVTEPEICID